MQDAIQELFRRIQLSGAEIPRPALPTELKRAEDAGFPHELLEFYRACAPTECIEFKQRIWSIENALVENQQAVPGCALFPHGFIVFASTLCGDSYCIDTNTTKSDGQHPVVLFSHEMIAEATPLPEIQSLRLEVAKSLEDFLVKFVKEELTDEPSYGN